MTCGRTAVKQTNLSMHLPCIQLEGLTPRLLCNKKLRDKLTRKIKWNHQNLQPGWPVTCRQDPPVDGSVVSKRTHLELIYVISSWTFYASETLDLWLDGSLIQSLTSCMNAEVKEMIKRFTTMQRWKLIAKNENKECKNTHTKIAWWMSSAFWGVQLR